MPIDVSMYQEHTNGRGLVEVLLRGHLWVEKHLISLLEADLKNPDALRLDRMPFSQKVKLADALGMLSPEEASTLQLLNSMRNRLAHDLSGEPTASDIARLESSVSESQLRLADKICALEEMPNDPELKVARRLAALVLAVLTEMEQHSQRHAYWREHRSAMEGYQIMVSLMEHLGATPETEAEYRAALNIPDPPAPRDAVLRATPRSVQRGSDPGAV